MGTKRFCDVVGCNEESHSDGWDRDVCTGWLTERSGPSIPTEHFKPYEHMYFAKKDLCPKHLKIWAKATYEALTKAAQELER
jgi:hypothetical protein